MAEQGQRPVESRAGALAKVIRGLASIADLDAGQAHQALKAYGFGELEDVKVKTLLRDFTTDVKPDYVKVGLRMLAKRLDSGDLAPPPDVEPETEDEASLKKFMDERDEHADWDDEDVAQEVAPWPPSGALCGHGVLVTEPCSICHEAARRDWNARGQELHQEMEREVDEDRSTALPTAEELDDGELLRALADNLSSSKHTLHRAAVARLYEIAEWLDAEPAQSSVPTPSTNLAEYCLALETRVRELETEKLKNMVARGRIEQEVDNLVTGNAFAGDSLETHHREIGALDQRIDTLVEQLDARYKHWDSRFDEVTGMLDVVTRRVGDLEGVSHPPFDFASLVERLEKLEKSELETKLQSQIDSITEYVIPGLEDKIDRALGDIRELEERALTSDEVSAIRTGLAEGP